MYLTKTILEDRCNFEMENSFSWAQWRWMLERVSEPVGFQLQEKKSVLKNTFLMNHQT